jgi:hypothetical protein
MFKKLQPAENDTLNVNHFSEDNSVTHYTTLWNEEKITQNPEIPHYEHSGNNLLNAIIAT